jgi:hypothetical protein
MLCTICKKPLNPSKDDAHVYRTVNKLGQGNAVIQWAKLPIHNACVGEPVENEIVKNRILKAANHPYFMFQEYKKGSKAPSQQPIIQPNMDGEYEVFISDGKYRYDKIDVTADDCRPNAYVVGPED